MHVILSIPAAERDLYADLKAELALVATVATPPHRRDLESVKLLIEIGTASAGFITALLGVIEKYRQLNKPLNGMLVNIKGKTLPLSDADELTLRRLLDEEPA